jgi:acetoin utilization deacetylase AcuC-like enzyme
MKIYYSPKHLLHDPTHANVEGHPFETDEAPERAERILHAVRDAGFGSICPPGDYGRQPLLSVHDPDYMDHLRNAYQQNFLLWGKEEPVLPGSIAPRSAMRKPASFLGQVGYYAFGVGSPILKHTWEAVYWSAQCAISAAHDVLQGERSAYALCRPPGHHAGYALYGGYCYLNNAAVAAALLGPRTAILDIDYHHGNGTQDIFYSDPQTFTCSLHAHPDDDYPFYWGEADEIGEGSGSGFNLNIPLPPLTNDDSYLSALTNALQAIKNFNPSYLVVSAGFDTLNADPSGGFALTIEGLGEIGSRIASLGIPCVIVQEGGYLLERLGEAAATFLNPFCS